MKPLFVKMTVLVIGIVVSAGAGVAAFSIHTSQSPFSFIPSGSELVIHGDYNNTSVFLFMYRDNISAVLGISLASLENDFNITERNITQTNQSSRLSVSISYFGSYFGYDIFSINLTNVSLGTILKISSLNFTQYSRNITIYAAQLESSFIAIGPLTGVEASIQSQKDGSNFIPYQKYIDINDPASFYFHIASNNSFVTVNGNVSMKSTNMTISTDNSSYLLSIFSGNENISGNSTGQLYSFRLTLPYGLSDLHGNAISLLEKFLKSGVLNAKNIAGY